MTSRSNKSTRGPWLTPRQAAARLGYKSVKTLRRRKVPRVPITISKDGRHNVYRYDQQEIDAWASRYDRG